MLNRNQYTQKVRRVTKSPTNTMAVKEVGKAPQKTKGIANIEVGI
jgi:hypothetical protein